jgi:hypothetical protein
MTSAQIGNSKANPDKIFYYDLDALTRHAAILGTTGSGKTVMCKVLVEEALIKGIPVIAIDPKGDIGGLAIANEQFDFRPFVKSESEAKSVAEKYVSNLKAQKVKLSLAKNLEHINTKIYTPKSSVGIPVSLIPKLNAPDNFKKITEDDPMLIPNFVDPISQSICELGGITGNIKEKAQALISSILIQNWNDAKDLTISTLISQITNPPFEMMGSLALDDFITEKERKKISASINLLLSSPSKQAWSQGKEIDVEQMFQDHSLSIFDMRSLALEEKQLVVEQILQEIYKYLLNKGGSEKLKYILYFDELAGILPPPPASPPCKKMLELLIRQARAFGLGIILATQNPGDIDYKVFGNIGTRFVGRLRTENDIEKVAVAMDLNPAKLKADVGQLTTGDFVYNNAIDNKKEIMHARWLYSYHGGPLNPSEIKLINNKDALANHKDKETNLNIDTSKIKKATISKTSADDNYVDTGVLDVLKKEVEKYSDDLKIMAVVSEDKVLVPNLKIVVEPREFRGVKLDLEGPFVFDLTSKTMPVGNPFKGLSFRQEFDDIKVLPIKRNIKETIESAIQDAKNKLARPIYKSGITGFASDKMDEVVNNNVDYLKSEYKKGKEKIKGKAINQNEPIERIINSNNKKIDELRSKIGTTKTKRFLKKLISRANLGTSTREIESWKKRVEHLERENERLHAKLKNAKIDYDEDKDKLAEKAYKKANTCIKEYSYRPNNKDIIIHATIMLTPRIDHLEVKSYKK